MKMRSFLLLAATCGLSAAAPQWLASPYLGYGYAAPAAAVVTGNSVPVSVGGYKAVAGSNGDLAGPVHEVPGLVPALAVKPLTLKSEVVATGAAVPVSVGGYKAVAGNNGELKGAVHEVPALFGAPALDTQENSNGGSLTVGTSALVKYSLEKREAEADPALVYAAHPYYAGVAGYPYAAGYPYSYGAYPYTYGAYSYLG